MLKLTAQLQNYPWGDTDSIASLQGREPTGQPEAEAWFGAHPSAPAATPAGPLDQVIAADPEAILGTVIDRDGVSAVPGAPVLPFLVKLLAAAKPLSIQAHPSLAQAREGWEREEAKGVPVDALTRNYKDSNHKPEILIALSPFRAMAGFRPLEDVTAFLDDLGDLGFAEFAAARALLADHSRSEEERLREVIGSWLSLDDPAPLANAVAARAAELTGSDRVSAQTRRVAENLVFIAENFPGDVGILAALLLNHLELAPGEAVFLPAGNLHAYLHGFGVEVMANSDNVLRGGLTPKHIDVAELTSILEFTTLADPRLPGAASRSDGFDIVHFAVGVPDFAVTRYMDAGVSADGASRSTTISGSQPTIILNVAGSLTLSTGNEDGDNPVHRIGEGQVELGAGEAVFVGAAEGDVQAESRGANFFAVTPGR